MFFRKKKVKFLGRGGIEFNYQDVDYLIDSEMLIGEEYDIVVYKDSVMTKDNRKLVAGSLKEEILSALLDYLQNKERLKVDLFS